MVLSYLFVIAIAAALVWRRRRAHLRRLAEQTMFVTSRPGVELEQPYGGWNADPYDAGTGHDRTPPPIGWRAASAGRFRR